MAYNTLQYLVLSCLSDLITCHSLLSLYPRHMAFLVPPYFKHACASEPRNFVFSAWHAIPHILHTSNSSFKSQYKWHLTENNPPITNPKQPSHKLIHHTPTPFSYSLVFLLAFIIIESVVLLLFKCHCPLLYPLEFKLHESRDLILFTVGINTSETRTMPSSWQ